MLFYHSFIFMYEQFGISFGYRAFSFFKPVQPFFSCAFIFICGICCRFSHNNVKRGLKLLVLAFALSFISIVVLPDIGFANTEVHFGILHLLSVSILIFAALERPLSKIPALLGILISAFLLFLFRDWTDGVISLWGGISYTLPASVHEISWLYPIGIKPYGFYSADYFPLIPYIFVFLMGSYAGVYLRDGHVPDFAYRIHLKPLYFLGTNALVIYLVHLPSIYVILSFYEWLVSHF